MPIRDWLRDIAVGVIVLALVLGAAFGVLFLGEQANRRAHPTAGEATRQVEPGSVATP